MKLKSFCKAKDTVKRTKQQSTEWEKIFIQLISNRRVISKIYKELKKLDENKLNSPIKKIGTDLSREFSTEESQMAKKQRKEVQHS